MKTITILVLLFSSNYVISQKPEKLDIYFDSLIENCLLSVNSIDVNEIRSLMIYRDSKDFLAKGFLIENNIPGGSINITDSIPKCTELNNIRMTMTHVSDSTFYIEYKFRYSETLYKDTCYVFSLMTYGYVAISKNKYHGKETLKSLLPNFYLGPSSSDDREVVQICFEDYGNTIFYPLD